MKYHSDATSVVLIAANGDFWLWFTTAPGHLVPEFVTGNQIADAIVSGFSLSEARSYLEVRMHAAGYQLRPSAIDNEDIVVWEIVSP